MKLGFDLDEVVVDLSRIIIDFLQSEYGLEWTLDCFKTYRMEDNTFFPESEELDTKVRKEVLAILKSHEELFKAKPMEGAQEALQKFKRSGHKLFFITARSKTNQHLTFKWLRKYDIPFDKLIMVGDKPKGINGKRYALDMFVDDQVCNLESMYQYKKRWRKGLLLFDKPWNLASINSERFIRVFNWEEILRHVGIANR